MGHLEEVSGELSSIFQDLMYLNDGTWNTDECLAKFHNLLIEHDYTCTHFQDDGAGYYVNHNKHAEISLTVPPTSNGIKIADSASKSHDSLLFSLSPECYGNYYCNFEYKDRLPTKLFNSFIRRSCPVRQSWLYLFIRNNLLEQANVSFWSQNSTINKSPLDLFNFFYKGSEIFEEEHNYVLNKLTIPYKNFNNSLEDAIIDSEKSLVMETTFESDNYIVFTEKTFRALQMPRPFLLFATTGSIQYLRNLGFELYNDYVDHSYDNCSNWIERQTLILQQLQTPIQYNSKVLEDFNQRAKHNQQILKNLKQQWPGHLKKVYNTVKQVI